MKHINSPVAGDADILVVPDMEAGNLLAKELSFLANADAAGIVLGARVPIVLTSRADNIRTHMASCAVAALYARAQAMARLGAPGICPEGSGAERAATAGSSSQARIRSYTSARLNRSR